MTTIINTQPPAPTPESVDSGLGMIFGFILAVILVCLFLIYGYPMLIKPTTQKDSPTEVNIIVPTSQPLVETTNQII